MIHLSLQRKVQIKEKKVQITDAPLRHCLLVQFVMGTRLRYVKRNRSRDRSRDVDLIVRGTNDSYILFWQ